MMTTPMIPTTGSQQRGAMSTLLAGVKHLGLTLLIGFAVAGCEDPLGLDDFLILSPGDDIFQDPVSFETSPTSTDTLVFQWEPAAGATRYEIVFAQAQSRDSLLAYEADLSNPTFLLPVDDPTLADVRVDPLNEADSTTVRVVQHLVSLSDLDGVLEAAGMPMGTPLDFVWTIRAFRGSEQAQSVERQRMILTRV